MMQPSKKRQRAGHRTGHNAARRHSREKGTTMFYIKPNEHTRIEITGENVYTTCPECGEEAEVYTRVVGYLRPVQNFNNGKKEEWRERVKYELKPEQLTDVSL